MPPVPTPQTPAPPPPEKPTRFSALVVGGLAVILLLTVYAWFVFMPTMSPVQEDITEVPEVPALSGSLLMASVMNNASATSLLNLDVMNGSVDIVQKETDYYPFSLALSGFIAAVSPDPSGARAISIARSIDKLISGSDVSLIFPLSPALYAWHVSWSPDARYVAYDARTALPSVDDKDIAHSYVILLDATTLEQTILDRGASPVFIDNDTIAYIGEDGLMQVTFNGLNAGEISYLFEFPEEYISQTSSQLAYSANTRNLVMTDPSNSKTYIMEVTDAEDGLAVSNMYGLDLRGISPTISPTGTHVALVDRDGLRVVSVDLASRDVREIKMPTDYDLSRTIIGAWK